MLSSAVHLQDEIIELRRRFHRSPEASFQEFESAEFAWKYLRELGFTRSQNFKPPALVAELGEPPFLLIRSDMDALPVQEQNVSAYMSMVPGLMHACGHDAHMACTLVAAKILSANRGALKKGLRIVFEPGTESKERCSARELIEQGLLADAEYIFGFHVDSTMPASMISIVDEIPLCTARADLSISSAAANALAADEAIHSFARIVSAMKEAFSGTVPGSAAARRLEFVQVSQDENRLKAAFLLRAESSELCKSALAGLEKLCNSGFACLESKIENCRYFDNKTGASELLHGACNELFPSRHKGTKRRTWSRDFEYYAEHVPAGFFYLGTSCGISSHHSPTFDLDERSLSVAVELLVQVCLDGSLSAMA